MVSLATRLFPSVIRDLATAREAQQLRGVDFNSGNLRERAGKYARVFRVVLVSTLEGSFQTAEAMQATGLRRRTPLLLQAGVLEAARR